MENFVTRQQLRDDFKNLGILPGDIVMLHASVKSVGWIVGGPDEILHALREAISPSGTLMMYVGWADGTQDLAEWPAEKQQLYREHCPAFAPQTSRAVTEWSILTEYLRTTPGALRSNHPEASVAAIGAKAEWLTENHPLQYGYGVGSPFDKLVQVGGKVLLLGTPLDCVTMMHFSECVANVPNKRVVRYQSPMIIDGERRWMDIEEFDTTNGIIEYSEDYFPVIVRAYLATGKAQSGLIGAAQSYLFDAKSLHEFAVEWMETHLR